MGPMRDSLTAQPEVIVCDVLSLKFFAVTLGIWPSDRGPFQPIIPTLRCKAAIETLIGVASLRRYSRSPSW